VFVVPFKAKEEEIGADSDMVKVKGENPATLGVEGGTGRGGKSAIFNRVCVPHGSLSRKPRVLDNSPVSVQQNKATQEISEIRKVSNSSHAKIIIITNSTHVTLNF